MTNVLHASQKASREGKVDGASWTSLWLATVPEEPLPVRLWVKHMMTAGENETEEVWQQTLAAYKIAWQALRKKGP